MGISYGLRISPRSAPRARGRRALGLKRHSCPFSAGSPSVVFARINRAHRILQAPFGSRRQIREVSEERAGPRSTCSRAPEGSSEKVKTYAVVFTPEAEEELAEIYRYIEENASAEIALRYTGEIVEHCESRTDDCVSSS